MKTRMIRGLVALIPLAALACGSPDVRDDSSDTVLQPALAPTPDACDAGDLPKDARAFLSRPEQQSATRAIADMEDACADDDAASVWSLGFSVFMAMETAIREGRAADAADGASLANGVIGYLCSVDPSQCDPTPTVGEEVFGLSGIFSVRGPTAAPIVAAGPVEFVDFDFVSNLALWGLETSAPSWAAATGAPMMLFFGAPLEGGMDTDELSFGDLRFELQSFPDVAGFATSNVHVGVCYDLEVELPHVGEDESQPTLGERLQRQNTILEPHTVGCGAWWSQVEVAAAPDFLGRALAFVGDLILPQPLAAAFFSDRRAPSTGGTPIDFSEFAPVAADPNGRLVFIEPPVDGTAGDPLNTIVVQALSGLGTPIELVNVTLNLIGNNGLPAGASFCDPDLPGPCEDPSALTIESLNGINTVATFDDVRIWKPGGYTICATGDLDGFTFEEVCAVLHIKN